MTHKVRLSLSETKGIPPDKSGCKHRQNVPVTQGVPLPKGALYDLDLVWMKIAMDSRYQRSFGRWVDGRTGV